MYSEHQNENEVWIDWITAIPDFASLTKSLKSTFTESYKQVDDGFMAVAKQTWVFRKERIWMSCYRKPIWKDGTTATTMIILNNIIYVANIGDSKAVVARKKDDGTLSPVCLTVDHNPMAHDERMRIQKTGAVVKLVSRMKFILQFLFPETAGSTEWSKCPDRSETFHLSLLELSAHQTSRSWLWLLMICESFKFKTILCTKHASRCSHDEIKTFLKQKYD